MGNDEQTKLSEVLMADWVAMHCQHPWLHPALLEQSQQVCKFMHACMRCHEAGPSCRSPRLLLAAETANGTELSFLTSCRHNNPKLRHNLGHEMQQN